MSIEMNVFNEDSLMKGALAYTSVANAMTVRTDPNSTTEEFEYGTPVKLVDGSQKDVLVDKADVGEKVYGFIVYDAKRNTIKKGDHCVIAKPGDVMIMEANASITVGSGVEVGLLNKVAPSSGINPIVGLALEKATADGDLIKVEILSSYVVQPMSFIDLNDTPSSYDGLANDTVKVNGTNDGLEFVTV